MSRQIFEILFPQAIPCLPGIRRLSVLTARLFALGWASGSEVLPPVGAWLDYEPGTVARVHFQGNPGVPYRLLRSSDLSVWTELDGVVENQRHVVVEDPLPPAGRAFYRVRPDVAPFPPARLDAAAAYSEQRGGAAVLVMQSGATIFEDSQNGSSPETPVHIASGTKVFFACALAAALEDGLIDGYDELVSDTITEWRNESLHPQKKQITIRHLAELSSGLSHDLDQIQGLSPAAADIYDYVVHELRVTRAPGSGFSYGPSHYYVFGVLLERKLQAAGSEQNPLEYLNSRLLGPIGLQYASWAHDSSGNPHIPNGASLNARNWARLGQFILQGGWWDGKQVIAESQMSALRVATGPNPGHGAFLWLNTEGGYSLKPSSSAPAGSPGGFIYHGGHREMVAAMGAGPSRMYIIPGRDAVIVRQTLGDTGTFVDTEFLELLLGSDPVP
jgi:CubicO group peptidase (beta-lactamase class C family)